MTKDDIIRMGKEATTTTFNEDGAGFHTFHLAKFARLVAAAEREACANACSDLLGDGLGPPEWNSGILNAVDAIRARGTP